jgi:hypothetical protein
MGTAIVRRHENILLLSGSKPLILLSLIFLHAGTVRAPSLAPASTSRPEAKLSPVVVTKCRLSVRISVTGNCDCIIIKDQRHRGVPIFLHRYPSPSDDDSTVLLGSDGFRRGDTAVLTSSLAPLAQK